MTDRMGLGVFKTGRRKRIKSKDGKKEELDGVLRSRRDGVSGMEEEIAGSCRTMEE